MSSKPPVPNAPTVNMTPTQRELAALPTFRLLLVLLAPPTKDQVAGLKRLLDTLFGIDINPVELLSDVTSGRPLTSPLNSRIAITLLASTSSARELVQSLEHRPLADRIHGVWVVLPHSPASPNNLLELPVSPRDLDFPDTLLLVPSASPLPEETATSISVALRHQGLPQAIVHFAPSQGAVEISRVSEATERLFVAPVGGKGADRKLTSTDAAGAATTDEERVLKRLVWVAAQRVSRDEKIATAISKGMRMFSVAVGASAQPIPFVGGATGVTAMGMLQQDVMSVYNFQDSDHVLKTKAAQSIVYEVVTGLPIKWMVSAIGLSWVSGLWEAPGSARTIMTAIADLVLILDALFVRSLAPSQGNPNGHALTSEEVKAVIKEYEDGPAKPSLLDKVTRRRSTEHEPVNARFSKDLVHKKLGKENISTFNVWKSMKRQEAQRFLSEVIREHRYHAWSGDAGTQPPIEARGEDF